MNQSEKYAYLSFSFASCPHKPILGMHIDENGLKRFH